MGVEQSKSSYLKFCEHCNEKLKFRTMNGGLHSHCIIYFEKHICSKNIQSTNTSNLIVTK